MRIVVHDYCGHPFQYDLSEELARRGHEVYHVYTRASGGPKAGFDTGGTANLTVTDIPSSPVRKLNFIYRWFQEAGYGRLLIRYLKTIEPDVIISSNTPLAAQRKLASWAIGNDIIFIHWLQDIISAAAGTLLRKKLGPAGLIVGKVFHLIEKRILIKSSHIVTIADDFKTYISRWGIDPDSVTVIPNWAPIDKLPVRPRNNAFSKEYNLDDKFIVLYAGTLGLKHNPGLIVEAAQKLSNDKDVMFVVISGDFGMDFLRKEKESHDLQNLMLLPFQDFSRMPDVLASADILLVLLEKSAGVFSVPSKVWSGFCAGRPSLLVVPGENAAAKIVQQSESGVVVDDDTAESLVRQILYLKENNALRKKMGWNAREYAEKNFPVQIIANRFEEVVHAV